MERGLRTSLDILTRDLNKNKEIDHNFIPKRWNGSS